MAAAAHLDVAVKSRGRPLQQGRLIRVASDAFGGIDTNDRGMARRALVGEKEMALRKRAGSYRMLNGQPHVIITRERYGGGEEEEHNERSPYGAWLHRSHRRPK